MADVCHGGCDGGCDHRLSGAPIADSSKEECQRSWLAGDGTDGGAAGGDLSGRLRSAVDGEWRFVQGQLLAEGDRHAYRVECHPDSRRCRLCLLRYLWHK